MFIIHTLNASYRPTVVRTKVSNVTVELNTSSSVIRSLIVAREDQILTVDAVLCITFSKTINKSFDWTRNTGCSCGRTDFLFFLR